jgi:hypothetical protein
MLKAYLLVGKSMSFVSQSDVKKTEGVGYQPFENMSIFRVFRTNLLPVSKNARF